MWQRQFQTTLYPFDLECVEDLLATGQVHSRLQIQVTCLETSECKDKRRRNLRSLKVGPEHKRRTRSCPKGVR